MLLGLEDSAFVTSMSSRKAHVFGGMKDRFRKTKPRPDLQKLLASESPRLNHPEPRSS